MFLEGLPVGIQKMPIRETTSKLRVCNPYQIVAVGGFSPRSMGLAMADGVGPQGGGLRGLGALSV